MIDYSLNVVQFCTRYCEFCNYPVEGDRIKTRISSKLRRRTEAKFAQVGKRKYSKNKMGNEVTSFQTLICRQLTITMIVYCLNFV